MGDCIRRDFEDLLDVVKTIVSNDLSAKDLQALEGADLCRVLNLLQMVCAPSPQINEMLTK